MSWALEKTSNLKLISLPHIIYHHSRKTAPIFTTFNHNTCLDSMNTRMHCDLLRTVRTQWNKKCGISLAAATLPELLYLTRRTIYVLIISSSVLLRMKYVSDKSCTANRNTYIMFNKCFSKIVLFIWKCGKIL